MHFGASVKGFRPGNAKARATSPSIKVVLALALTTALTASTAFAQPTSPNAPPPKVATTPKGATPSASSTAASAAPSTNAAASAGLGSAQQPTSSPSVTTTAAPTPAEEAAAAFQLGRDAFKANEYAKALELFQKSFAMEATPGTLLNIALTEEKLGKVATALQVFERVLSLLKADDDRLPIAKEGIARVQLRLPRLKIDRAAGAPPTLAIRLDGQPIAANLVGVAQPLDPGLHEITTSVYGFEDRTYKIDVREGQTTPFAVEPGKRTLVASPTSTVSVGNNAPKKATLSALGIAGAGIASLGVGIVTGVLALSKKDELVAVCPTPPCNAEGSRILGEARTMADVSTGTLIFGGIATAAGAVMLFTIGDGKSLFVSASATPAGASLRAIGRF